MTREADIVLRGRVQSKSCQRDSAGRIYTRVELAVIEVWKGAVSSNPFLVVHGGGVLGDQQAIVTGQVQYQVGEEVVAFLVRNSRGEGVTLGLVQGKFEVWQDKKTGAKFAVNPFHGVPEVLGSTAPAYQLLRTDSRQPLSVSSLQQQVQEAGR